MQRLEVSGAVRPLYVSLGRQRVKNEGVVLLVALCGFETVCQIKEWLFWGLSEMTFYWRYFDLSRKN